MLCVAGFDGYFKRVNPAWHRILGYDEADLLSRPVSRLRPSRRSRGDDSPKRARLTEGKDVLYFENRYLAQRRHAALAALGSGAVSRAADSLCRRAGHHRAQSRRRDDGARCPRSPGDAPRARRSGIAAGATRQGAGSREAARRGRRRNQERVSREHEPRDPDAAQRHSRDDHARAPDPALRRTAGLPDDGEVVVRVARWRSSTTSSISPKSRRVGSSSSWPSSSCVKLLATRRKRWRSARLKRASNWPAMSARTSRTAPRRCRPAAPGSVQCSGQRGQVHQRR